MMHAHCDERKDRWRREQDAVNQRSVHGTLRHQSRQFRRLAALVIQASRARLIADDLMAALTGIPRLGKHRCARPAPQTRHNRQITSEQESWDCLHQRDHLGTLCSYRLRQLLLSK